MSLAGPGGAHYRAPLLVPTEPLGYGVKRSSSFQSKATPEAGAYAGLAAKGAAAPVPTPGLQFPAPGAAYAPAPHPKPPHGRGKHTHVRAQVGLPHIAHWLQSTGCLSCPWSPGN